MKHLPHFTSIHHPSKNALGKVIFSFIWKRGVYLAVELGKGGASFILHRPCVGEAHAHLGLSSKSDGTTSPGRHYLGPPLSERDGILTP